MSRRRPGEPAAPRGHLKVLPGEGRRFAHLRKVSSYYLILGLLALLILQAAYHWTEPLVLSRRLQIITAGVGRMERKLAVEGLHTRRELLLRAPCTGVIVELAPSGERAPVGATVAVIVPLSGEEREGLLLEEARPEGTLWERIKHYFMRLAGAAESAEPSPAPLLVRLPADLDGRERVPLVLEEAGLLLHRVDGWEDLGERAYRSAEEYSGAAREDFEAVAGLWVEEGQPLMKLIDNWQWYYNLLLPLDPGRSLASREAVLFEFDFAPDEPVVAALAAAEIDPAAEAVRLTYRLDRQFPGFEGLRWSAAEIVLERQEGVIIPAEALVEREGGPGVFINRGGAVRFQEVTVVTSREGQLLVEGLEPDSLVITRPGLVEEGRRLN